MPVEIFLFVSLCIFRLSQAYMVTVDAHGEECFMQSATAGSKLNLMYEVSSGGFLDIDLTVKSPDDRVLISKQRESDGRFTILAPVDGVYTCCFDNKMSTMTPKEVMFDLTVGDPQQLHGGGQEAGDQANAGNHTKLEEMINELSAAMLSVKHEQDYMEVRERIHRSVNESTNSRVVLWSFFEALLVVAMAVGQVYYLKRFFEVRRVV